MLTSLQQSLDFLKLSQYNIKYEVAGRRPQRNHREEQQMGNPVLHFEVVGRDAQALQDFYREAFGWRMEPVMPAYAMAYPGVEGGINGGIGAAMDGGPGHVTFYVEVPDLEAALEKVESLGGRRVAGPMDVPNGPRLALFADAEGHVVGLTQAGSGRVRAQS